MDHTGRLAHGIGPACREMGPMDRVHGSSRTAKNIGSEIWFGL